MKFKVSGNTERAREENIKASLDKKYMKNAELIQESPPILIITHKQLGKWLKLFSKKLSTPISTFYNNPTWVNSVTNKVLKTIEKQTGVPRSEFKVVVLNE